ncbi:hypothetical protein DPX16_23200 [Anabarilius grahami]|uniref:Sfi1 spindle body domain-containing protein n=1 Tax=Anabarilius grahami TaxID=495550 RepID=A0A3N0YRL5_ANAGA|nr:hypothetical protein DPX16_23200 [Anabarilius grahami]
MPLPEENADEPQYAQKDGTTSYKNTPLSKLPSILTFGSEPFIQQTLFKRGTDCAFDLPLHKNIYSVSESASGSKYARRDTTLSEATALICCNTAAKHKREQWKTPERDFTEYSSLSTISKKDSPPTCFNSADIAYKPQKEALAFQRQDERLSSCTFHELLESSWMSANLHCSMLHFNSTEQAVSFVEHQTPNLSVTTSAVSSLTIPVVKESERHSSYIPRDIKIQPRNEQLQRCNTRFSSSHVPRVSVHSKQPNKSRQNEDFVRDRRPDGDKLTFDGSTEINPHKRLEMQENLSQMHPLVIHREDVKNHTQTMQRVYLKEAYKYPPGLAGSRNEIDGQYFTSHQHSPFTKFKAVAATEARISAPLDVAPEASDDFDEKKIEERCEDLYRFRLRLRCLRLWSKRLRFLSQACCHDRRRVLSKALYVLRRAAKMHCAQNDAVERRRCNFLLYQSFYQWKNHYESGHLDNSFHNERNTAALRKRLIQPSRTLVLMTTCSTRRNLHVLRTAVIHYHLSVLYKHWLLWRQACLKQFSRRQQEWWACSWWGRRLQSKVWTLWIITCQRKQLATDQSRVGPCYTCHIHVDGDSPDILFLVRCQMAETYLQTVFISVESTSPAQCIASALLLSQKGSDTQDMLTAMEQISTATLSAEGFPHPPVSYKTEKHRSAQDRAVQRAVLLEWYRHTQAVFSDGVLLFTARLAHLHPSSSSSSGSDPLMSTAVPQVSLVECENCTAEDDSLERSVLTHREQHCPLLGTESQHSHMSWTVSEEHRSLLSVISTISEEHEDPGDERMVYSCFWGSYDHCRLCRSKVVVLLRALGRMMHPDLSLAFSQWRSLVHTNRDMRLQADLCRKSRRPHGWSAGLGLPAWANRSPSRAVEPYCEQQKCAVEWMERKAERHRLNLSFSMWVTCVCKQRQASALSFSHYRLLRVCFCQWRMICAQQQLANSKVQHRLQLRVKAILQQWRKHAQYRAHRLALLCEYDERRKIVMKRRTFRMWSQAVEFFRRSQHYHQRALKYRYFSQWLHEFKHQSELLCISRELEEVRAQRLQRRAFCLWQFKLSHVHSHILHITSLIHRLEDTRHLRLYLCVWRERLVERKRARLAMHQWRQHISRARKQRNNMWRMKNMFLCWKAAFRQRVRSRDHCTQRWQRRVLLAWHRQTVSAQRLRYREAWFQYSSEMRLLAAVFIQWRKALIQGQQRKCAMESQLIIYQSRVRGRAFHRWRTVAMECRAIKTFNNRLLHKMFKRWTHSRDLLKVADMFCVKKERSEAQLALTTWSLWAKDQIHHGGMKLKLAIGSVRATCLVLVVFARICADGCHVDEAFTGDCLVDAVSAGIQI